MDLTQFVERHGGISVIRGGAVVARSDADEWAHIVAYDRETGQTGEVVPAAH